MIYLQGNCPQLDAPISLAQAKHLHQAEHKEIDELKPYLLTKKHPAYQILKDIFSFKGVLSSIESMKKAGFHILMYREGRGLVIAKHHKLHGLLIKTYLDTDKHVEWTRWLRRVKGRERIKKFLDKHPVYSTYMKVPQKWIYKIPNKSVGKPRGEGIAKEYILIAEDMKLVDKLTNVKMFQTDVSYKMLDGLYLIIDQTGFSDGHIANVPFSKDGRIAFIDTEYTNTWPVHFEWLTKWFSPNKQAYWKSLIDNKGPTHRHIKKLTNVK